MASGTVRWFDLEKGFGLIRREDGDEDLFVEMSEVERSGLPLLGVGQAVVFDVELHPAAGRSSATNIKLA